jgi:hypothetical protein
MVPQPPKADEVQVDAPRARDRGDLSRVFVKFGVTGDRNLFFTWKEGPLIPAPALWIGWGDKSMPSAGGRLALTAGRMCELNANKSLLSCASRRARMYATASSAYAYPMSVNHVTSSAIGHHEHVATPKLL